MMTKVCHDHNDLLHMITKAFIATAVTISNCHGYTFVHFIDFI